MGTINSAFSLISQALDADQSALSIVANNVANANTPGYTRENANWRESRPIGADGVFYGAGVTQTGPTSVRNRVLAERLDQQQQLASASGSRLTALNSLQALFAPASGSSSSTAGDLGSDITSFFSSFSSLEANPTNNALRQHVLSAASTLAGDLSNAAANLNSQKRALDQEASGVTSQVNSLTSAIAKLNQEIQSISPDGDAGVLEDQRQLDLNQLSKLVGINQITTENNGLTITTTSGQTLVSVGSSYEMNTGTVDGVTHFFVGSTDVTSQLATGGGELGGDLMARDQDIPGVMAALDQLAYKISTELNAQNNLGSNLAGVSGSLDNPLNIFNQPSCVSGSAASMTVVMTDPNQISASGAGQGSGDNSNAVAMANLSGKLIVNGQTPINYYSNLVSTLGSIVSGVENENTALNASVAQLQTQNNALSSVNLNDEAVSMTLLERSYQAATQVFAMLNKMMGAAINLGQQTSVS